MKQPLVSVVIPIYNVEKYLEECFDSVINQSYGNLEIVLVDDGSTDTSGQIADALGETDSRVVVVHKPNGGLSDARNAGISIARGDYITFIDSDDYVDVAYIEELIDTAITSASDIVQSNNSRNPNDLSKGSRQKTELSGSDAFVELMKFKTISPTAWGKLYKTSIFSDNKIHFPVGRLHEDTAVLYKLVYLANKVSCIDSVLYYYRINQNSIMTASYTQKHYESVEQYHNELDSFIAMNGLNLGTANLSRHKALRLLSVLNKLAINNEHHSEAYRTFKQQFISLSRQSNSPICLIALVPVNFPVFFRSSKAILPKVRMILGKV